MQTAAYRVERDPANPKGSVVVSALSMLTGKDTALSLPVDLDTFIRCRDEWHRGALIQNAFPMLSADHREFLKTGITPEEWKRTFGE